ncbi:hypothetical protein F5884DRAFT_743574 [Xylogone sp. PMI_703]|nr:hypothetical protein F5884DRAFT_743574 [Xylogone sp. PMI_703]
MFPSNMVVWLLLTLLASESLAQTFPSIPEVDFIFPRNDTCAPTPLMPVVFAIQNPSAANTLDLLLMWTISSVNCTQFSSSPGHIPGYVQVNNVTFATKNGAPVADLAAAMAADACAGAESFLFNVTGTKIVSVGNREVTTCAIVAPMSVTPTPTPCATKSTGSGEAQSRGTLWVAATLGWLLLYAAS